MQDDPSARKTRPAAGAHDKAGGKRQEILENAVDMIKRDGPANFSMRRVADEVGIKLGTLQYYFPNKDELMRSTGLYFANAYHESLSEVLNRFFATPLKRLEALIDFEIVSSESPSILFSILSECKTNSPALTEGIYKCYELHLAAVSQVLEPLTPHLSSEDRRHRAAFMISALDGSEIFLGSNPRVAPKLRNFKSKCKKYLIQIALVD